MTNPKTKQRELIAQLKAYRRKHDAVPSSRDLGQPFKRRIQGAFGSWNAAIVTAFGPGSERRRLSDDEILERIRRHAKETKTRPTSKSVGASFGRLARERFGSWNAAVEKALGIEPSRRVRPDEELLEILRTKHTELKRLPMAADVESIATRLWKRFGGLNEALEVAIGTSARLEILRALKALTPPNCEVASSHEIASWLNQRSRYRFDVSQVGVMLERQHRLGMVHKSIVDVRPTWRLTVKGHEFVRAKEKQYAERRS